MSTSMKKLRGSNRSMMSGELLVKSGMSRVARESIPQIPAAKKILPQSVFWRWLFTVYVFYTVENRKESGNEAEQ